MTSAITWRRDKKGDIYAKPDSTSAQKSIKQSIRFFQVHQICLCGTKENGVPLNVSTYNFLNELKLVLMLRVAKVISEVELGSFQLTFLKCTLSLSPTFSLATHEDLAHGNQLFVLLVFISRPTFFIDSPALSFLH